jgi:hypothetical protein
LPRQLLGFQYFRERGLSYSYLNETRVAAMPRQFSEA